jgi:uncharacterized protein YodC (DUF2158 family)
MAETFGVGDVVSLKSGSPRMTVRRLEPARYENEEFTIIHCIWFHDNRLMEQSFLADTLENAPKE